MKKVYKYATGQEIPEGAIYLNTVAQTKLSVSGSSGIDYWLDCWLVWHYFLVEVEEEIK